MQVDEVLTNETVIFSFENEFLKASRFDIQLYGIFTATPEPDVKLLSSPVNRNDFIINTVSTISNAMYHGVMIAFL